MQFTRRLDDMGKSCVYLDLEGLQLGIRDQYPPGQKPLDEQTVHSLMAHISPFQMFRVDTYNTLKAKASDTQWNYVFGPVNQFLRQQPNDVLRDIAETLLNIHHDIIQEMYYGADLKNTLADLTRSFSKQVSELDHRIDLVPRLEAYVREYVPINTKPGVGSRPQDKPEMTFHLDEVMVLTTCTVLSKLLSPILGVYIEHCKKQMDTAFKDLHCAGILHDILDDRYRTVIIKFQNFLSQIISRSMKDNIKHILNGCTLGMISQQQYAKSMVRNLVCINLYRPDGNLMTFLTASTRDATRTPPPAISGSGRKLSISELHGPQEIVSGDEGNMTVLECGSKSSANTVDHPHLIDQAASRFIEQGLVDYDLSVDDFHEALGFYGMNPFPMTAANSYLLGIIYGQRLGGAKGIHLLTHNTFVRLIVMLQLQLLKHREFHDLIPLLTVTESLQPKIQQTHKDGVLKTSWNSSAEFRNCEARFQLALGDLKWSAQLSTIVEWLQTTNLVISLAPTLAEKMGSGLNNDSPYEYPDSIIQSICQFIWSVIMEDA